jgi:hypothetical protein
MVNAHPRLAETSETPFFWFCSTPSSLTRKIASQRAFSKTPIARFVIRFRQAAPETAEGQGLKIPALIFLRKWLYAKHFPLA